MPAAWEVQLSTVGREQDAFIGPKLRQVRELHAGTPRAAVCCPGPSIRGLPARDAVLPVPRQFRQWSPGAPCLRA